MGRFSCKEPRLRHRIFDGIIAASLLGGGSAFGSTWQGHPVVEIIEALRHAGPEVLYSSDLVPSQLRILVEPGSGSVMSQATEVLAAHGLQLRSIEIGQFIVTRSVVPAAMINRSNAGKYLDATATLREITVSSSRYAFDARPTAPAELNRNQINALVGTRNDVVTATRVLPGTAAGASSRPHIRGSQSSDILVRFDGIPLEEPFHLKAFQQLISSFDSSTVDGMVVYTGGYPVRYGTRSDGVIDIEPRTVAAGRENELGLSLLAANAVSVGRSADGDVDWLFGARRSTIDWVLDQLSSEIGNPQFVDVTGRVRWQANPTTAWIVGTLWLDDRIRLHNDSSQEIATSRSRDLHTWVTFEFNPGRWRSRSSAVLLRSEKRREGTVDRPQFLSGNLNEGRELNGYRLSTDWSDGPPGTEFWNWGAEFSQTGGEQSYLRLAQYTPAIAQAFGIDPTNQLALDFDSQDTSFAAFAAAHPQIGRNWDAVLGLRFDGQRNRMMPFRSEWSPRVNLRYRLTPKLDVYGSWGKFTQAQRPDELRLEEGQRDADPPQVATHTLLGFSLNAANSTRWQLELYRKRWSRVTPYFDNLLDALILLPDLDADRIRIAPSAADAHGAEISVQRAFGRQIKVWGSYTWARVVDDVASAHVLRSWDQRSTVRGGLTWTHAPAQLSLLLTYHSGWPRTNSVVTDGVPSQNAPIRIETRNSDNWPAFFSLDLRTDWTRVLRSSTLHFFAEMTNTTNHGNQCCFELEAHGAPLSADIGYWLPRSVNAGVTWTFH